MAEAGRYRLLRVSETSLTVALALFCPRPPAPNRDPTGAFQRADLFMPCPVPAGQSSRHGIGVRNSNSPASGGVPSQAGASSWDQHVSGPGSTTRLPLVAGPRLLSLPLPAAQYALL